ncbi:MAG: 16S rRNA (cytidine(1402)-2'-O)-methyltransferase [Coxiella sp. (in: Bacteria)]|nr:MAG: 16S rRNA (cytidine(1402)-2'-O)-methyltransferase [Coxiella sp. (in: g-proteobacteria)]
MNTPTLYIVATPIGNLDDMTIRAVDTLKAVDLIAAEDTRHSRILLNHYHISTAMTSLHGDNEAAKTQKILDRLAEGQSIALISDAGTPLISDPGEHVSQRVREQGFAVVPIPGPCALIAALSVAGLSTKKFRFEGFLPHKGKMRREGLEVLCAETATLIFYESRHRILDFLKLASTVFGANRRAAMARELTKQFETVHVDTLQALNAWVINDKNQQKGEYVVLIEGAAEQPKTEGFATDRILSVLSKHLPTKQAAKLTAEITGESQRGLYQRVLDIKEKGT